MATDRDQLEGFTKFISEYDFDLTTGKLDLSSFTSNLSYCLAIDRQQQPPHPRNMFEALRECLEQAKTHIKAGTPGLANEPVRDWRPEMAQMYPNGQTTTIHLASLLFVFEAWIFSIGQMIPDRATDRGRAYLAWPRSEWYLTNTFLQRFHSQVWDVLRREDLKTARDKNFSSSEAMSVAKTSGVAFGTAADQLKMRNQGFTLALKRVDHAIAEGFPLEAIAICESLVSACLHHFLESVGGSRPPESFARLIDHFRRTGDKAQSYPGNLVDDIDAWRRKRNDAVHRFVATNPARIAESQEAFLERAGITAIKGREACAALLDWFQYESFFFLKTEFDLPGPTLN
ncbi:hypothetical protein BMI91_00060 [Thioclava sediminum]|uniref:RiboL-PSP-HEPN domain-containing protein n=1 Tax=Thioclava sediminum TaxID=1915319 RepID=A0ABX3MZU2_9RHOB|nr:hypothetical protein [Thioclava sediminum]OOY24886.1 hypothetical protein BMI91_00060 [Thioclava sediminum]